MINKDDFILLILANLNFRLPKYMLRDYSKHASPLIYVNYTNTYNVDKRI